jgi:hypothetical protein
VPERSQHRFPGLPGAVTAESQVSDLTLRLSIPSFGLDGRSIMGFLSRLLRRNTPPQSAANLGRNEPCWCGSGKKYKHCHFDADREYFTRIQAAACKGPT